MSSNARSPVAFGSYIITRRIARGGMAEIYRARTRATEGKEAGWVAVKMMRSSLGHEELRSRLFEREARIARRLDHPNVVPVFEYGTEMDRPYLAMEYIRGRDLSHLAKSEKSEGLPFELSLYVGHEAAAGLGHAHRATDEDGRPLGIVHRDVSPGNVMLGYAGNVKVLDFGVARMNETQGFHTQTGTLRGKFAYMSPEQTLGEDLDARSDVFSLGTVLYELLTGINCFRAANPIATLERVQKLRPVPPSRVNRLIPKAVDKILARCLAKDRRRRFRDAQALRDAIGEFLNDRNYDGSQALVEHLNQAFSWEKHEEESELLREEEEVALLEVVDFAALRDRSELDAKHIAISEQEEASQSEVKNVARRASGTDLGQQGVFEGDDRPPSRVEAPINPMDQALDAALDLAPHATGEQVSVSSLLEAAPVVERKTEAVPNPLLSAAGARANLDPATSRTEQASLPSNPVPPQFEGGTDSGDDLGRVTDPGTDPGTDPSSRPTIPPATTPKKRGGVLLLAVAAALVLVTVGVTFAVSDSGNDDNSGSVTQVDPVAIELDDPEPEVAEVVDEPTHPKLRRLEPIELEAGNKPRVTTRVKRRHPTIKKTRRTRRPPPRRATRKKTVTGFLNVGAKPWASITINGKPWPYQTPQAGIELPVGKHRVTLTNPQTGKKKSTVVYIKSGAYKTVMMDLRK